MQSQGKWPSRPSPLRKSLRGRLKGIKKTELRCCILNSILCSNSIFCSIFFLYSKYPKFYSIFCSIFCSIFYSMLYQLWPSSSLSLLLSLLLSLWAWPWLWLWSLLWPLRWSSCHGRSRCQIRGRGKLWNLWRKGRGGKGNTMNKGRGKQMSCKREIYD